MNKDEAVVCPACSLRMLCYIDGSEPQWRCAGCNADYSPDYICGLNVGMKQMSDQAKHVAKPLQKELEMLKSRYKSAIKRCEQLQIQLRNSNSHFPQAQGISGEEARRIIVEAEKRTGGSAKYAPKPSEIDGEYLLWTGAKIKKRKDPKTGQPRYYIQGYVARGQDVEKIITWLHIFNPDNYT